MSLLTFLVSRFWNTRKLKNENQLTPISHSVFPHYYGNTTNTIGSAFIFCLIHRNFPDLLTGFRISYLCMLRDFSPTASAFSCICKYTTFLWKNNAIRWKSFSFYCKACNPLKCCSGVSWIWLHSAMCESPRYIFCKNKTNIWDCFGPNWSFLAFITNMKRYLRFHLFFWSIHQMKVRKMLCPIQ